MSTLKVNEVNSSCISQPQLFGAFLTMTHNNKLFMAYAKLWNNIICLLS